MPLKKKKKRLCLFSFVKAKTKKGRKHLAAANLIAVKMIFFLVSRYETALGELCVHFEIQVGSPWTSTSLDVVLPNCC